MVTDHYKRMLAEYPTDEDIDKFEPDFPKAASRCGTTFTSRVPHHTQGPHLLLLPSLKQARRLPYMCHGPRPPNSKREDASSGQILRRRTLATFTGI